MGLKCPFSTTFKFKNKLSGFYRKKKTNVCQNVFFSTLNFSSLNNFDPGKKSKSSMTILQYTICVELAAISVAFNYLFPNISAVRRWKSFLSVVPMSQSISIFRISDWTLKKKICNRSALMCSKYIHISKVFDTHFDFSIFFLNRYSLEYEHEISYAIAVCTNNRFTYWSSFIFVIRSWQEKKT